MRNLKALRWAAVLAVLALILAACGDANLFDGQSDDSGRQGDLEAGIEALNEGDWAAARAIFDEKDPNNEDPEVAKYKASTYLAEAGFDGIELLRELSAASDTGDSGEVLYDALTRMFDDGDGVLTAADVVGRQSAVEAAIEILGGSLGAVPTRAAAAPGSGEQTFQAGLYAAVYAVLSVVEQLEYPAGSGNLLLSVAALQTAVGEDPDQLPIGNADGSGPGVSVPELFNQALGLVYDAVFALDPTVFSGSATGDASEVQDALLEFLGPTAAGGIGYLDADNSVGTVTDAELRTYLHSLLD